MKKIIGTDCSLKECVASGYMMLRYDDALPLADQQLEFVQLLPDEDREFHRENGIPNRKQVSHMSLAELYQRFEDRRKTYCKFADDLLTIPEISQMDAYDVVSLADSIQAYDGFIFS